MLLLKILIPLILVYLISIIVGSSNRIAVTLMIIPQIVMWCFTVKYAFDAKKTQKLPKHMRINRKKDNYF